MLAHPATLDIRAAPILTWHWKINRLISKADSTIASREDSPVRIALEFDGDKSKLTLVDRAIFGLSARVSGRELPYATLIYIWANHAPLASVIANIECLKAVRTTEWNRCSPHRRSSSRSTGPFSMRFATAASNQENA